MLPSDFSKKPIAAGLLVALYGATALAQDAAVDADEATSSEGLEEVLVTGIRYSIKRSMDLKRSDEGVMDAITAKDMGAFPDTNLAESLQRITGVSIERERGEGKYVTVRGFGPAFNRLKAGPNPRTVTYLPSPRSRSIDTPVIRCRDSARLVSGNAPMSLAVMASITPSSDRLRSIDRLML